MTQTEFAKWLESVLGDTPLEELVDPTIFEHMNRVHLENEQRAWNYAREEALEAYEVTIRAMCKTMFAIGYDAGREQARIDSLFGGGSGLGGEDPDEGEDADSSDDDRSSPRGLLPSG